MKAQQAYRDANSGLPPSVPNDIFKPSEDTKDELSIFSGKTHTLTAKSTSTPTASSSKKSRSTSDSPQLVFTDNPSFEGAHPSLVSELNVFNGLIKSQIEDAFKAGGEVFGGGPMVVDGGSTSKGSNGGVHHPSQMHTVRQQQQFQQPQQQAMYQPDYQRQHFDQQEAERLERERREAANREMERQEMERQEAERQELARQQQLLEQRELQRQQAHEQEIKRQQQHELLRQQEMQQQMEIRRQQERQQQQMQDEYHQQLEIQQRQSQQRRQSSQVVPKYRQQHHSYDRDQPQMLTEPDHGMVQASTSSSHHYHAAPASQRHLPHSQSQPNIHQVYQQQQHYQPMPHPSDTAGPPSYPPAQHVTQRGQQHIRHSLIPQQQQQQPQHSMYTVPPEYSQYSGPDAIQSGGTCSINYVPPTPISATSSESSSSYIPYWSAASNSFAMPDQQPTGAGYGDSTAAAAVPRMQIPDQHHHRHYTPEGALRGIAADDRSLQETWQSYMNKVTNSLDFACLSKTMLTDSPLFFS